MLDEVNTLLLVYYELSKWFILAQVSIGEIRFLSHTIDKIGMPVKLPAYFNSRLSTAKILPLMWGGLRDASSRLNVQIYCVPIILPNFLRGITFYLNRSGLLFFFNGACAFENVLTVQ